MSTEPRIYVACLASYNNGVLHGRWIDLDGLDYDDLSNEIAAMLRESPYPNITVLCPECTGSGRSAGVPCTNCKADGWLNSAEEWAVHDSEGLPAAFRNTEWPDLRKLTERLDEMADLDDDERDAYDYFCEVEGDADVDTFRERFIGSFNSWTEVAEHYVETAGLLDGVSEALARYFDFAAYGRDMRVGGDAYESGGYYFWNH